MEVGKVRMTLIQRGVIDFTVDLWTGQGSWFWRLGNPSNTRRVVGSARSADEAAGEAIATLAEADPAARSVAIAPALLDSALIWSGILDRFGRALGANSVRIFSKQSQNDDGGKR
jgi:hypothetical protein